MAEASVKFALVDINDILKTLPHRYPMLLIDRVNIQSGELIIRPFMFRQSLPNRLKRQIQEREANQM